MADKFYTAKEARELLGMTHSALLNQVIAGNLHRIIPPGRRQGVYLKEEVDKLRREMDAWMAVSREENVQPTQFMRATLDDMPAATHLTELAFGSQNIIPVERRIEWLRRNPDIDYVIKQEGEIVGFLSLVPLRPETIEDLLTLRRYAKDLTADDILSYTPGTPIDIYGMAIGVRPGVSRDQKRRWGARLISGAFDVIIGLGKRGMIIRSIWAHSYKPDGINLMKHIGFMETEPKAPGLRDFMIPVQESGIPVILAYKEALRQWQEEHHQEASTHQPARASRKGRQSQALEAVGDSY
jgi:hypothetical protein